MFKLIIDSETRVIENANLKLRWCTNKKTEELIKKAIIGTHWSLDNLHILFVTITKGKETGRHLVPIKNTVTFLPLQKAGKTEIHALMILGSTKQLQQYYLSRSSGRYSSDIVDVFSGKIKTQRKPITQTKLKIIVPENLFGKKPSSTEKKWLNRYHTWDMQNECHIRKARLFAYILWPLLFPFDVIYNFTIRFIFWLTAALCLINASIIPVITPWKENNKWSPEDLFDIDNSILSYSKKTKKGHLPVSYKIAFIPAVSIIIFVASSCYVIYTDHMSIQAAPWITIILLCTLCLVLALIDLIANILVIIFKHNFIDHLIKEMNEKQRLKEKERRESFLKNLSCKLGTSLDFETLPTQAKTIKLRYQYVKASVCRPLSK